MELQTPIFTEDEREPQSTKAYERVELIQDMALFDSRVQELLYRRMEGLPLSDEESAVARQALEEWWEEKFGFNYGDKRARAEVLARKHSPSEQLQAAWERQKELFEVLAAGDLAETARQKGLYEMDYPDQLEAVEVMFGLQDFFAANAQLYDARERGDRDEAKRLVQEITQFQFLISHFVELQSGDKEYLEKFWSTAERLAGHTGNVRTMPALRRSVVSQVATYKAFAQIGGNPHWSHPKEDAFNAIDLWGADDEVVQVKGTRDGEMAVYETDTIGFPGVTLDENGQASHFSTQTEKSLNQFRAKVNSYSRQIKRPLRGYMVQIPYSKIDFVTGEPAPEAVEMIRQHVESSKH